MERMGAGAQAAQLAAEGGMRMLGAGTPAFDTALPALQCSQGLQWGRSKRISRRTIVSTHSPSNAGIHRESKVGDCAAHALCRTQMEVTVA